MGNYSEGFKKSILVKVLPPQNRSKKEVAIESGITVRTIDNWLKKINVSTTENNLVPPESKNINEKMTLIFESKSITEAKMGKWLRENGLHSEHISQWEQEIRDALNTNNKSDNIKTKDYENQIKTLQKDLNRKNKALAEVAALLTLKKKAQDIWGDLEDE